MAIREGRWDCKYCGTTGIRGSVMKCPGCGRPRGAEVDFYLPEGEPEVRIPEKIAEAKAGPDWICNFCGTSNRATHSKCMQCGAERGTSPSREVRDYDLDEVPRSGEEAREKRTRSQSHPTSGKTMTGSPSLGELDFPRSIRETGLSIPWQSIAIAAGIVGMILLLVFILVPHDETLKVAGFNWKRSVSIESFRTVTRTGWEGELPGDARIVSQSREIHHYDQVACGTEQESYQDCEQVQVGTETYVCGQRDLGNGYFEDIECRRPVYETRCETKYRTVTKYCDEPVYKTKYTYQVDRWVHDRTERASGDDHEAYWPGVTLAGNERESGRSENYSVVFVNRKEKTRKYSCDYGEWSHFRVGQIFSARVNRLGVVTEIKRGE